MHTVQQEKMSKDIRFFMTDEQFAKLQRLRQAKNRRTISDTLRALIDEQPDQAPTTHQPS